MGVIRSGQAARYSRLSESPTSNVVANRQMNNTARQARLVDIQSPLVQVNDPRRDTLSSGYLEYGSARFAGSTAPASFNLQPAFQQRPSNPSAETLYRDVDLQQLDNLSIQNRPATGRPVQPLPQRGVSQLSFRSQDALLQDYERSVRAFQDAWNDSEVAEQAFDPYSQLHHQYIASHRALQQAWIHTQAARIALYPDEDVPGTPQRVSQARFITQRGRPFRPLFE